MAKIIITEAQSKALIDYLQNNPNYINEDILEESVKDWILGTAMILGLASGTNSFAGSGHNKFVADKAVSSQKTMGEIKSVIEDQGKLKQLTDAFQKLGMANPDTLLAKNAEKFVQKFNEISKNKKMSYHLDFQAVTNLMDLDTKIKQGYAMTKNQSTADTVKSTPAPPITIEDTLDIKFDANNFFVSGGFQLSPEGIDSLKSTLQAIVGNQGKIISINVTSSTDAESINRQNPELVGFVNANDVTGNIGLANARSQSVIKVVTPIVPNIQISHNEIPNNGADVVSQDQFKSAASEEERAALEAKSAPFRYVNLSIKAVFTKQVQPEESAPQVIEKYRFTMAKVIADLPATKSKPQVTFKMKKYSCKKPKNAGSFSCYTH